MNDQRPGEAPLPAAHSMAQSQPAPKQTPAESDVDFAFSSAISPEAASFGSPAPQTPLCTWCNAKLPSRDVARCPTCGVLLTPADVTPTPVVQPPASGTGPTGQAASAPSRSAAIPGWPRATQAPQQPPPRVNAAAYEGLTPEEMELLANSSAVLRNEINSLGNQDAFLPPNRDVRQAMLEIEFEADRADPMRIVEPGPLADKHAEERPL